MADKNKFRIIIATDTHLGCYSTDPVRKNDSFDSFEETLKKSVSEKADFLLLGGDLFHHSRPAQHLVLKCMRLLRKYCLGAKEIEFEIVSDQSYNFEQKRVNYEDPNYNISLPVFSIHGNHDDPIGLENISVMDIFSTANYINYFGKAKDITKIDISPIFLQKGTTKLAIYGLGSVKDERLHRLFLEKKVRFVRPAADRDSWFNIFVIHQNRIKHSYTLLDYIPENFIPSFIDLVIWGHEHESIMQLDNASDFYILQPGSTVRTSLSKNELPEKHIGLLEIEGRTCKLTPIPLETIRPFQFEEVELSSMFPSGVSTSFQDISKGLSLKVNEMIERVAAEKDLTEKELFRKQNLPLIRLRVEYSGFEVVNVERFGQDFVGKVANPKDILLFYKKRNVTERRGVEAVEKVEDGPGLGEIPELIRKQILKSKTKPSLLPEEGFITALLKFVEKSQYSAIDEYVEKNVNFVRKRLETSEEIKAESKEAIREKMRKIMTE